MADIAPLAPLRYDPKTLGSVVAPPYDVIGLEERARLAAGDAHNVVRLILPEGEGDAKYGNAASLLDAWRAEKVLVRDEQPAFYRYDQTFAPPGGGAPITRRGFLALVRLVPFSARVVLPHERTLSGPKEDRLKLFRATRTNLSPGFMLYRDPRRELDAPLDAAEPLADFTTDDGVRHALAKVTRAESVRAIVLGVARSTLLIADGHHRYETALRYCGEVDAAHPGSSARAAHRYFMTFLANGDDPNLVVFPTHRHVHGLASFSFEELIAALAKRGNDHAPTMRGGAEMLRRADPTFAVRPLPAGAPAPELLAALRAERRAVVACAPDGRAALVSLRAGADLDAHPTLRARPAVLRETDVTLLHAGILEHVLGITQEAQAAKTNIWYPQDAAAALSELRGGRGDVLFLMNATPVAEVRAVAEAGEVMPQKSTFFYPKVLTGLAIHTLEPDRSV